jgi:hypothetical protein
MAYVGFTGGTGQKTAIQHILNWTYSVNEEGLMLQRYKPLDGRAASLSPFERRDQGVASGLRVPVAESRIARRDTPLRQGTTMLLNSGIRVRCGTEEDGAFVVGLVEAASSSREKQIPIVSGKRKGLA